MRKLICTGVLAALSLSAHSARAQGGPPLITDDPDTPGPRYWEINLAAIFEKAGAAESLDAPRIDANYGVGRRIQLKIEAPWVRVREEGEIRTGAGNAEAGVKYRFIGEEGRLVAWSVYPQVEFGAPRASVHNGVADGGRVLFLPTEITVEKSHVEVNLEVGPRLEQGGGRAWVYGASTEGHVTPRVELLAEVHAESIAGRSRDVVINVGGRPKSTKQVILLLSAGHAVGGNRAQRQRLLVYAGLQFNLPGLYDFAAQTGR